MPRLYQQLLSGLVSYDQVVSGLASYDAMANSILTQIKIAHAFRQVNLVKELAEILLTIPLKEYRLIAQYYLVWCRCREGYFDIDLLESIIDRTTKFKVKALSSRATFEWYKGDNETAMYFYKEALKASPTVSEYIDLTKAVAVLKSQEGFRSSALKDLESLIPRLQYAEPLVRTAFLNTYAPELAKAGRLAEAMRVIEIAAASPFEKYYPEIRETMVEIGLTRRRSVISLSRPHEVHSEAKPDQETQKQQNSCIESAGNQFATQQKREIIIDILYNLDDADLDRLFAFAIEIDD